MQGIESWLLPHQQISDLFQDATVPKGTWRIMEMLNSHRHRENGKKQVTRVPSADYLKPAVYFWSMFQETGKTTGWGWDGNKRDGGMATGKLLPGVESQPAPSTPLLSMRNMGKWKILDSRHACTSDRAHSQQPGGKRFGGLVGVFFWI